MEKHREIARDALHSVQQMFVYQLSVTLTFAEWDFRDEPPSVVREGNLPARSLEIASSSDLLVAILGSTIPPVTGEEIKKAARRKADGENVTLLTFLNRNTAPKAHKAFTDEIKAEYGVEIVWTPFETQLQFQSKVMTALVSYGLGEVGFS